MVTAIRLYYNLLAKDLEFRLINFIFVGGFSIFRRNVMNKKAMGILALILLFLMGGIFTSSVFGGANDYDTGKPYKLDRSVVENTLDIRFMVVGDPQPHVYYYACDIQT